MNTIQKIEKLLEQKRMTKYKLAKESGLPQSTITSLMSGRIKNPSLESLTKISNALGVSVSQLLDRDEEHTPYGKEINNQFEFDEDVRILAREIQDLNAGDKDLLKAMIQTMRERGREARSKE